MSFLWGFETLSPKGGGVIDKWFLTAHKDLLQGCRPKGSLLKVRGEIRGNWSMASRFNKASGKFEPQFRVSVPQTKGGVVQVKRCIINSLESNSWLTGFYKKEGQTSSQAKKGRFLMTFGDWDLPKSNRWKLQKSSLWGKNPTQDLKPDSKVYQ